MASPENPLVAVVTGASQGIGRSIARQLGAHRARVALVARNIEGLAGAVEEINAAGMIAAAALGPLGTAFLARRWR